MTIILRSYHRPPSCELYNSIIPEDSAGRAGRRMHIPQKPDQNGDNPAIQGLPFEILRHIFLLAVTLSVAPISPSGPPPMNRRRYRIAPTLLKEPMSFTHVCSWWRAVARAVPELWMSVSGMQDWTHRTTYGVLRVWMDNMTASAAPCPMDLHLAHPLPTPPDAQEALHMARVLRLFWDHMGNVCSLTLRLESSLLQEMRALIRSKSAPAMALEEADFTFVLSAGNRVDEINRIISWLGRLPSLRQLRWIYLPTGRSYQGINIEKLPWDTLEEVLIRFPMSLETAVACVSRCTPARTISLEALGCVADSDDNVVIDMSITILPNLSSLTIYDTDATRLLINYLTLPALKYLNIRTLPGHRPGHATIDLKAFLIRSQCRLEGLVLRQPNEWPPDAKEFYSLPGIANLKVLDLFYHKPRENLREFLDGGGREHLTQLGIPKVMIWGCSSGYQALSWEEHVGWKDRLGKDDTLSDVYEFF